MSVLTIRSMRRYAMRLPVEVRDEGAKPADGLLIEISQQGARISNLGPQTYDVGQQVKLAMPDGREMAAIVRWAHDGLAGVKLLNALHLAELTELLQLNRDNAVPTQAQARYA